MSEREICFAERQAILAALEEQSGWARELKERIDDLVVDFRDYNTAGGVTHFLPLSQFENGAPFSGEWGPSVALFLHPDMPHGGAFIVWMQRSGVLIIEGNADGDSVWPSDWVERGDKFEFSGVANTDER